VTSFHEGIKKVRESDGKYAFAVAQTTAKYEVGTPPCNLMSVGEFAGQNSRMAVRKGDPFREKLDDAITQLKDNDIFYEIRKKWLEVTCKDDIPTSGAGPAAASIFDSIALAFLLSAFY